MKHEFEIRADPPSVKDGFRFLVLVYDRFARIHRYRLADYSPRKLEWREPGTFEKIRDYIIGWLDLPDPEDIVKQINTRKQGHE